MIKLLSVIPLHCENIAISQVFYSLCNHWQGPDLKAHMIVPSCADNLRQSNITEAISPHLRWYYYRLGDFSRFKTEKLFLKQLKHYDAAYIYPGVSSKTTSQAYATGKPLFLERVNCFTGYSKQILDRAYAKLGLDPQHEISAEMAQGELQEVRRSDFVLCPSQTVTQSFIEAGVPAYKLITTSEGWCPERFPYLFQQPIEPQRNEDEFTVIFMGSDSIRKGLHILLKVWEKANIKGKLIITGQLDPIVAELYGDVLARPDVRCIPSNPNYASTYRIADLFVLPSLEEGSPLVTYEAMAHGLPILASPMGAGGIVRDGVDGMVFPPEEEERWIDTLIQLSTDVNLRRQMGANAQRRAADYTWDKVAARRARLMLEALGQPAIAC